MAARDKPREQALLVLRSCEKGLFVDDLIVKARRTFARLDSAFLLELVYGVLRNRSRLDWSLDRFSAQPVAKTDDWTRNILRLGAYQLLFLDRVPPSAAVNTSTELAKEYGKKSGYVNGLLRTLERKKGAMPPPPADDPVRRLSLLYSHPEWLVRRWLSRFGPEETENILRENNRPAPLVIRTNTLAGSRDELMARLAAEGALVRKTAYSPWGIEILSSPGLSALPAYHDGCFMVQDEAAQLVAMMLDPQRGETVLDACAAPGGKTTHLAELMGNSGTLVALESDAGRIGKIQENTARLNVTIVTTALGDAARYEKDGFDRVLIDAPCSGLGVLRRHPDGRWNKREEAIRERAVLQRRILAHCSKLLKRGGVIVYATCTTEPEENEDVISDFLAGHPDFIRDDPRPFLPASAEKLVDAGGYFRTFPVEPVMDGFFGARMTKQ